MFYYIMLIILFIPLSLMFPTRVIGRKNIPKKGRIIFAPNHQTLNDPIIIGRKILKRRFRFMAKRSLFKNKFLGKMLRGLGAYPVDKDSVGDIGAVKQTLKFLKEDKAVCIFPEGTRLKPGESNQLKDGVAMFALKTQTPIIPAYFVKKTNVFVFNTLIIGEPIYLHEKEDFKGKKIDKEIIKLGSAIIRDEIDKLKKEFWNKKKQEKK